MFQSGTRVAVGLARPCYLDLCRLFTTDDLRKWYRHIALAEEELRLEFEYMAASGLTPETYGLRVRSHSDGLIVTALNKMLHARTLELSFSGELKQTPHFATDKGIRAQNVATLTAFLKSLGADRPHTSSSRTLAWLWEATAEQLCDEFLRNFAIHPQCHTLDVKRLIDFIRRQNQEGELTTWTVALVNNSQVSESDRHALAGLEVGLTERAGEIIGGIYSTSKANIQSPTHQAFDLAQLPLNETLLNELLAKQDRGGQRLFDGEEEKLLLNAIGQSLDKVALVISKKRAREQNKPEPENPNGRVIRELRPVRRGLLLIYALTPPESDRITQGEPPYLGLAFSFPTSHTAKRISYEANKVLIQELHDRDYED